MRLFLPALVILAACGTTRTTARIVVPATIPLRTFPFVMIVPTGEPAANALATSLQGDLSDGQTEAHVLDDRQLLARRQARTVPAASVVVRLRTEMRRGFVTRNTRNNETICGPNGCFTRPRTVLVQVPTLRAELVVNVHDGPSGRALQEARFSAEELGGTVDVLLQDRVTAQLRAQLRAALDARSTRIRVVFLPVPLDGVDEALEDLRNNDWPRGRERLEQLLPRAEGLGSAERAAFFYNLALALRFEGQELAAWRPAFERAESLLRRAVRLEPNPRYQDALRSLEAHQNQLDTLAAQNDAAAHNFRMGALPPPPPPPPGYRVEREAN